MDYQSLKAEVEQKTAQTIDVLHNEYAGLRTGRASTHLLDGVRVNTYGSDMPLNQLATVSTPDNQTLTVTVWVAAKFSVISCSFRSASDFQKPGFCQIPPNAMLPAAKIR